MSPRVWPALGRRLGNGAPMRAVARIIVLVASLQALGASGGCSPEPQLGDPLPDLNDDQLARFNAGKAVFEQAFTPEQGLGPLFNADACGECHEDPVVGGAGDELETHIAVPAAGGTCDMLLARGGPVFQAHATPALTAATGDTSEPLPGEPYIRATRSSPDVFGMGLLDAVPERDILSRADSADRNKDGISGRANRFMDGRVGRFGRKAFVPSLDEFNTGAFVIEMGITNPGALVEETIGGAPIPPAADSTPEPELGAEALAFALDFVRFLAPPPPVPLTSSAQRGRALFSSYGCVSCHTPALKTGANKVRALNYKTVYAYTDLLLHDMGPERADICLGLASPSEFRTEPLMGLRFLQQFMHDGKASTPDEAIEMHGGEGWRAREKFRKASSKDREALLEFLRSL